MNKLFYPRLALQNIGKNRRFYVPYILSIMGASAAFYILLALNGAQDLPEFLRYQFLSVFMYIGCFVIGFFAIIFLFYTNSFLMKRRMKELGLYNILGMGKRHIAHMLCWETVYTALFGIGLGIAFGMLLQKLATMLLFWLIKYNTAFSFYVSLPGIVLTVLLFGGILVLNLLYNLLRIRVQNPVELLRGGNTGEKEPRSRYLLAIIGIGTLGAGYYIAVTAKTAMDVLGIYFVAVFLVIIGTYCLFTAISIAVLKLLRNNKNYYYKTSHFIGVSGMLYRMKRNAVGLANICILSTMVLVMASGTLSLYAGTEDILDQQYPTDIRIDLRYAGDEAVDFDADKFAESISSRIAEQGLDIEFSTRMTSLKFAAGFDEGSVFTTDRGNYRSMTLASLVFITAEEYAALLDVPVEPLAKDEVLLHAPRALGDQFSIDFKTEQNPSGGRSTFKIARSLKEAPPVSNYAGYLSDVFYIVVADDDVLGELYTNQHAAYGPNYASNMLCEMFYNISGTQEQKIACALELPGIEMGFDGGYSVSSRAENAQSMYSLNGGFFFLGMFLSLVFIMAAAMIIYYKQISEGYEDAERYKIMEKVGLDKDDIRRSINSQVLTVFFMPLIVAAVHVAFDFKLMTKLLLLFELTNVKLTLLCTGAVLLAFVAIYGIVYTLTAREYARIVS